MLRGLDSAGLLLQNEYVSSRTRLTLVGEAVTVIAGGIEQAAGHHDSQWTWGVGASSGVNLGRAAPHRTHMTSCCNSLPLELVHIPTMPIPTKSTTHFQRSRPPTPASALQDAVKDPARP